MKRAVLIFPSLILLLLLAGCAGNARTDSYSDGYSDGYRIGYEEGHAAASFNSRQNVAASENSIPRNTSTYDYVLNTNTKKFHYPDCRSVDQMSDRNKSFFSGTREEVIAMGYKPCGNCHP